MDFLERTVCQITGANRAARGSRIQSLWSGYGEILKMELQGFRAPSVVVKHVAPPALKRERSRGQVDPSHARKLRSYAIEMNWYEHFAHACTNDCRVPQNFGCRKIDDAWVFVLEDLDAAGFAKRLTVPNPLEIEAVLRWLAAFHATFFGRPADGLWSCGSYWHLATRTDELARIKSPLFRAAAGKLDARLNASRYQTLVHGDAKLDNFCFPRALPHDAPAESSVAAVDFQYVGRGCGMRDVAYFFSSVWGPSECVRFAEDALTYYFDQLSSQLSEHAPEVNPIEVESEWRALYPVAWADFQRFLCGWAPGHYDEDPYARQMLELALTQS